MFNYWFNAILAMLFEVGIVAVLGNTVYKVSPTNLYLLTGLFVLRWVAIYLEERAKLNMQTSQMTAFLKNLEKEFDKLEGKTPNSNNVVAFNKEKDETNGNS